MKHSTSDTGFFQELPVLSNQFFEDSSFQRVLRLFLPSHVIDRVEVGLAQFGQDILSDRVFSWVTDSERNRPYLKGNGRDAFGRPTSELVVGEGWRGLQDFGIRNGIVATGYDSSLGSSARPVQFLKLHLWEGSASSVPCPSAMQDGAARLLQLNLARADMDSIQRKVLENALHHLLSRDPATAWTSGQWMTERAGGSDVSLTETVAEYIAAPTEPKLANAQEGIPLGPWSISGFKWFSSATDSAMTILLARTQNGISAFFAPMKRQSATATTMVGRPRGIAGTELNGVRIQRLKNKSGTQSAPPPAIALDPKHVAPLLRVLTPLCKAYVCKKATPLLYSCMEALGGVGYLLNEETEYLHVARLDRDCCVLSIWEGTTDVLATDFLRALKHAKTGAESIEALDALFATAGNGLPKQSECSSANGSPADSWEAVKKAAVANQQSEIVGHARDMLWSVAEALVGLLLQADYRRDSSQAVRDILCRRTGRVRSADATLGEPCKEPWDGQRTNSKEQLDIDFIIVYGRLGSDTASVSKL
ncbi:hypothetical protein CSUB01_08342 [Colletotrichum sublineola]|uniref:Uncharacterized protein n=1 Tax=Colletotrichum sublineola TaxID=1173701 RepID=A0A066XH21_COLSU|nr:hypothetical protein CSUB01_08342 [Colletotrichum sublineola]